MSLTQDRLAAAAAGLMKFTPSKPCKNGHTSERYTSTGGCIACLNQFKVAGPKLRKPVKGLRAFLLAVPPGFTDAHATALQASLQGRLDEIVAAWGMEQLDVDAMRAELTR